MLTNNGFSVFGLGPITLRYFEGKHEMIELRVRDIIPYKGVQLIKKGKQDLEWKLSQYNSTILILVYEYLDTSDGLRSKTHATCVKFNHSEGKWLEYDCNQDGPRELCDRKYQKQRTANVTKIIVGEWGTTAATSDHSIPIGNNSIQSIRKTQGIKGSEQIQIQNERPEKQDIATESQRQVQIPKLQGVSK